MKTLYSLTFGYHEYRSTDVVEISAFALFMGMPGAVDIVGEVSFSQTLTASVNV